MKRFALCFLRSFFLSSLFAFPLAAQPELTASVQLGYPFLIDRQGYYNRLSPAVSLQAGWRLRQSRLYPSVRIWYSGMQVAVQSPGSGYDDLNVSAETLGGMLLLNTLLKEGGQDEWLLSGGIGISGMSTKRDEVFSGANGPVAVLRSTGANLKPVATGELGLRWLRRLSYARPLYFSAALSLQYLYLHQKEEYLLNFPSAQFPASAGGHLLMPILQLGLCWQFGRE